MEKPFLTNNIILYAFYSKFATDTEFYMEKKFFSLKKKQFSYVLERQVLLFQSQHSTANLVHFGDEKKFAVKTIIFVIFGHWRLENSVNWQVSVKNVKFCHFESIIFPPYYKNISKIGALNLSFPWMLRFR